jgi:hypothetical protein
MEDIDAIRARLSPDDDTRFRVELLLANYGAGKQAVIDDWTLVVDGDGATFDGTMYIEAIGRVVE